MLRRILMTLVLANIAVGAVALAGATSAPKIVRDVALRDCCQESQGSEYCCRNCCWFIENCADQENCNQ